MRRMRILGNYAENIVIMRRMRILGNYADLHRRILADAMYFCN